MEKGRHRARGWYTYGDSDSSDLISASPTSLLVTVPPHDPGTVDLTVYAPGGFSGTLSFTYTAAQNLTWLGTLRARLGYAPVPHLLLYATGGLAYSRGQAAAVFDITGSYLPVWLAAIALSVVAAALCVPIDERAIQHLSVRPA